MLSRYCAISITLRCRRAVAPAAGRPLTPCTERGAPDRHPPRRNPGFSSAAPRPVPALRECPGGVPVHLGGFPVHRVARPPRGRAGAPPLLRGADVQAPPVRAPAQRDCPPSPDAPERGFREAGPISRNRPA